MKELIATSAITVKNFVFINPSSPSNSTAQVRQGCMAASKKLDQLRRDPAPFLQTAEPILLLENAQLIEFHSAEHSAINRAHDLGRYHRPAVFRRKGFCRARKKLPRTRRFEFHQTNETFVMLSILQLHFGITEASQIFLRQI